VNAYLTVSQIKKGLVNPKDLALRDQERKPLTDHLNDWHAYLIGKGACQAHSDLSRVRVARLVTLAKAERISEVTPVQAAAEYDSEEGAPSIQV
jgi:hypothetical protein